jgi:hypothetical protein
MGRRKISTMNYIHSKLALLLSVIGFFYCSAQSDVSPTTSVQFGTLDMGLRSRSQKGDYNGTTDRFVMDLLSVTVYFLDNKIKDYFINNDSIQFQRVSATFQGYEIREEEGSVEEPSKHYEATISIVKQAFMEDMEDFLKRLWDISRDPFLRETSAAIVVVNSTVQNDSFDQNSQSSKDERKMAGWLIALLAAVGAFCVGFVSCSAYICATKIDPPMLQHDVPVKSKSTASGETDEESRLEGGTEINQNTNFGTNALCSPSTVHSLTSQDSSLFTYNPKSVKSYISNGSKTYGSGFFTANSGLEVDLQAWQNGGTVIKDENRAPFGHDISAITSKKDLSLIEEEDLNDLSVRLSSSTQQYFKTPDGVISPRQYLTEAAVQDLELADRWGSRNRNSNGTSQMESFSREILNHVPSSMGTNSVLSPTSMLNSRYGYSMGLSTSSKLDLEGSSSDVINDLKDLSYQIDTYRQRSMNN